MSDPRINEGIIAHRKVHSLLQAHDQHCMQDTPNDKMHELDIASLQKPDIRFFTLWLENDNCVGCIALRNLGAGMGEVKSMHVLASMRGRSIADQLITHLIGAARMMGMTWLGLETGATPSFDAARRFYLRHGFQTCAPFGEYTSENSGVCMERRI